MTSAALHLPPGRLPVLVCHRGISYTFEVALLTLHFFIGWGTGRPGNASEVDVRTLHSIVTDYPDCGSEAMSVIVSVYGLRGKK